jgi:type IV pilus assembly protein PilF
MRLSRSYRNGILCIALTVMAGCARTPVDKESYTPEKLAEINTQLGAAYLQEGNYETALSKTRKAVAIDPNYASAYNVLGVIYNRLGQNHTAEENFKKAVSLDPNDSGILNNYGQFLCQKDRFAEAQTLFQKALANPLYATPEVAHANAGVCALRARDLVKAEAHLRSALAANPRMPTALLDMAAINYEQRRYAQARAYLQRHMEIAKHTPRSLWLGIRIGRMQGDHDVVASYALALKSKYPDAQETRLLLESEE